MVVAEYVTAMLSRFEWDAQYGCWVANDCTGIYIYNDYAISLSEIIFIVDNDVSVKEFMEWYDYYSFAMKYGLERPNLESWIFGCPRLSKEECENVKRYKKELNNFGLTHK